MNGVEVARIRCPYCGEAVDLFVDCSIEHQAYVEDCRVCCRPIEVEVRVGDDGNVAVHVRQEGE